LPQKKQEAGQGWPIENVERRATDELVPYARNARTHSDQQVDQIAASIAEWGWTMPVLIDEGGVILAGHGRVLAARRLGIEEVPVIVAKGWSEPQRRAYVLADNKLTLNGGWDEDLLRVEIADLELEGFELELAGWSADELSGLLGTEVAELEAMPELPSGDREPFQQMTFTLHDDQAEQVRAAIEAAKRLGPFDSENENSNGNALARICETFATDHA
jgi:ParB-like chromosome segregation protein Spo0J